MRVEAPQLGVSVGWLSAMELMRDDTGWWVQQQPPSSLCAASSDSGTSRASSQWCPGSAPRLRKRLKYNAHH